MKHSGGTLRHDQLQVGSCAVVQVREAPAASTHQPGVVEMLFGQLHEKFAGVRAKGRQLEYEKAGVEDPESGFRGGLGDAACRALAW